MKHIGRALLLMAIAGGIFYGCKKEEPSKTTDERLSRPYCNDPEAVNYNWDFPGTPDNSICFYPDEMFEGTYLVFDTTFDGEFVMDSSSARSFTATLVANTHSKMLLSGYVLTPTCTVNNLSITATRFYKATVDSTFLPPPDSMYLNGAIICNNDTLSGTISKKDKTNDTIMIDFTIAADSGLLYHRGKAIRQ